MAELDLEHIAALKGEPARVVQPGAAQSSALKAARRAVELLAVMPGSGHASEGTAHEAPPHGT